MRTHYLLGLGLVALLGIGVAPAWASNAVGVSLAFHDFIFDEWAMD
jgi:hypothetical protein